MASTSLQSIGNTTPGVFGGINKTAGNPSTFYPANASQEATPLRMIELFFCPTEPNGQISFDRLFNVYVAGGVSMIDIWVFGGSTMICSFRNSVGTNTGFSFTGFNFFANINKWHHFVMWDSGSFFCGAIGLTGFDINGQPVPGQEFSPIPTSNGTVYGEYTGGLLVFSGGIGGFRQNASDDTVWAVGTGVDSSGGSVLSSSIATGLYAELRMWTVNPLGSTNDPLNGPDINVTRTEFIDSTQYPELAHCWRMNEDLGTPITGFEDVGFNAAVINNGAVGQFPGFGSHPFGPSSGGNVDLQTPINGDTTNSEDLKFFNTLVHGFVPPVDDTNSDEVTPALLPARGFVPPVDDTNSDEVSPTLTVGQGFNVTDTTNSDDVPNAVLGVPQGFNPPVDDTNSTDTTVLSVTREFAPVLDNTNSTDAAFASIDIDLVVTADETQSNQPPNVPVLESGTEHSFSNFLNPDETQSTDSNKMNTGMTFIRTDTSNSAAGPGWRQQVQALLNPEVYYELDSGTALIDSSGNGNDGIVIGTPPVIPAISPATSPLGFALDVSDPADFLQCSNASAGNPGAGAGNPYTIVFADDISTQVVASRVYAYKIGSVSAFCWRIRTSFLGRIIWDRGTSSGGAVQLESTITFASGSPGPRLVICTFSELSGMDIYIDGQAAGSSANGTANDANTASFRIGDTADIAIKHLDDFIFSQEFVSAAQALDIYNGWRSSATRMLVSVDLRNTADETTSGEQIVPTLVKSTVHPFIVLDDTDSDEFPTPALDKAVGFPQRIDTTNSDEAAAPGLVRTLPMARIDTTNSSEPTAPPLVNTHRFAAIVDDTQSNEPAPTLNNAFELFPQTDTTNSDELSVVINVDRGLVVTADETQSAEQLPTLIKGGEVPLQVGGDNTQSNEPAPLQLDVTVGFEDAADDTQSTDLAAAGVAHDMVPTTTTASSSEPNAPDMVLATLHIFAPPQDETQSDEAAPVQLDGVVGFDPPIDDTQSTDTGSFDLAITLSATDTTESREPLVTLLRGGEEVLTVAGDDTNSDEQAVLPLEVTVGFSVAADESQSDEVAPTMLVAVDLRNTFDATNSDDFGSLADSTNHFMSSLVAPAGKSTDDVTLKVLVGLVATNDDTQSTNNTPTKIFERSFSRTDTTNSDEAVAPSILTTVEPFIPAAVTATSREGYPSVDQFLARLSTLPSGGGGPSHLWRLNEGSGTSPDSGLNGTGGGNYIGTFGGQGIISTQDFSTEFQTTLARVSSDNTTSWQTTGISEWFTYGAWFTIDSFSAPAEQWIFNKQAFIDMAVLDDGSLRVRRTTDGASFQDVTTDPGVIQIGQPYFAVVTWERVAGKGMTLYVNGAEEVNDFGEPLAVAGQNSGVVNRKFRVGVETAVSGELFDGKIQYVFMYRSRALDFFDVRYLSNPMADGAGAQPELRVDRGLVRLDDTTESDEDPLSTQAGTLKATIDEAESLTGTLCDLEAYLSVLDIWNVGLTKLGIETLTSTNDNVPQALAMAANWGLFKENFLRDHIWNGAKTTVELSRFQNTAPVADVVPADRWTYAYELPSTVGREWVRSVRLNGRENRPGDKARDGLGLWEEEVVWNDAGTPKMCLVTDQSSAKLEYIFKVADNDIETLLPSDMQWAMALSFAVHMAADLGSNTVDINQLEQQAEVARRNARRTDGQSGAKVQYLDTTIADSFY